MKIFIYGASGLGKEVYDLVKRNYFNEYKNIIFVDDFKKTSEFYGAKVVKFNDVIREKEAKFVVAVGEPFLREEILQKILQQKHSLATLIDKTAVVSETAKIEAGAIICAGVSVSSDTYVGKNVYVQPNCIVGHDAKVFDNCVLSSFATISGGCKIEKNTYIGIGSAIKQGLVVGKGAIVGMGSVLIRDCEESMIVAGNPARGIGKNISKRVFG